MEFFDSARPAHDRCFPRPEYPATSPCGDERMLLQRICRHFLKMRFLRWTESSKAAGDAALLAALFQLLQGQYPGQYDDNGAYDGEEGVGAHSGLVTAAQRQVQAPQREGENARVLEREHHIGGGNEPKGVLGDHRDVDEDDRHPCTRLLSLRRASLRSVIAIWLSPLPA